VIELLDELRSCDDVRSLENRRVGEGLRLDYEDLSYPPLCRKGFLAIRPGSVRVPRLSWSRPHTRRRTDHRDALCEGSYCARRRLSTPQKGLILADSSSLHIRKTTSLL
jgi:hypothetical protein